MSNHPDWVAPKKIPIVQVQACQEWCPNCKHFFKEFGLNNCHLVNWSERPLGGRIDVLTWLKNNSDPNTRINNDADHCPGFQSV